MANSEIIGAPKTVLDVCCGGKAFWFNHNDSRVLFLDKRMECIVRHDSVRKDGRKWNGWTFEIAPDLLARFENIPLRDSSFHLVVFDPPHMTLLNDNAYMAKQYGRLEGNWPDMLRHGFSECFRVLVPNGVLVFKWNECQVPVRDILALTNEPPLFGHKSGKQSKTHWIVFMKGAQKNIEACHTSPNTGSMPCQQVALNF